MLKTRSLREESALNNITDSLEILEITLKVREKFSSLYVGNDLSQFNFTAYGQANASGFFYNEVKKIVLYYISIL